MAILIGIAAIYLSIGFTLALIFGTLFLFVKVGDNLSVRETVSVLEGRDVGTGEAVKLLLQVMIYATFFWPGSIGHIIRLRNQGTGND